jgi:hypothetical protein
MLALAKKRSLTERYSTREDRQLSLWHWLQRGVTKLMLLSSAMKRVGLLVGLPSVIRRLRQELLQRLTSISPASHDKSQRGRDVLTLWSKITVVSTRVSKILPTVILKIFMNQNFINVQCPIHSTDQGCPNLTWPSVTLRHWHTWPENKRFHRFTHPHWRVYIVGYRPVARQRPRNKRDNNRCYATAR